MKKLKLLFLLSLSSFCVTGCDLPEFLNFGKSDSQQSSQQNQNNSNGQNQNQNGDNSGGSSSGSSSGGQPQSLDNLPDGDGEILQDGYYKGIDTRKRGTNLLKQLRDLNSSKRKSTVGYNSMGTTPSGDFKYTDYDPSTVRTDSKGQKYGTKLISFYSGNSASSGMNREHVWPNSHGGNLVEDDIHMVRPTIKSENGSRGNSFYVEGMKSGTDGWDPAAESFGKESYRGDSARIIFYCVVASSKLSLVDDTYHYTTNANKDNLMGKLSDMLKWNLAYSVLEREEIRNSGAQYLQGNRNPFIDHPEFACKIWGTYNQATKQICGGNK